MASHAPLVSNPPNLRNCREVGAYRRRRPEESVLYRVVQQQLETFLARAEARDRPMPRFVEREFRNFLRCGILAHGFVRVHCDDCRQDRVVAFSCKGRGFCPSCGGRRMADTAAHLVDRVLPEVPVRQWVLSLPFALRYRLAYDAKLTSAVLGIFVRAVFASLRDRARKHWQIAESQCGAVTFVQRFGGALNLNVHFHSLLLDGVYAAQPEGKLHFHPLPPPSDAEVGQVATRVAQRIARLLERRGLGPGAAPLEADPLAQEQPLLAALYGASVASRIAMGPRAGRSVLRVGDQVDADDLPRFEGPRCASVGGLSLHANVAVPARDRQRLERLCRYVARPPVATERLSQLPDGQLVYRLKQRWRDGTTHVLFSPQELIEKLAALVPPPRFHGVRYHGVLGPRARARQRVVPGGEPVTSSLKIPGVAQPGPAAPADPRPPIGSGPVAMAPIEPTRTGATAAPSARSEFAPADSLPPRARRVEWAELLRRVFAVDVLACPRCGGRMRLLSVIHPPEAARAILECLDLPARAPPTSAPIPDPSEVVPDWEAAFETGG